MRQFTKGEIASRALIVGVFATVLIASCSGAGHHETVLTVSTDIKDNLTQASTHINTALDNNDEVQKNLIKQETTLADQSNSLAALLAEQDERINYLPSTVAGENEDILAAARDGNTAALISYYQQTQIQAIYYQQRQTTLASLYDPSVTAGQFLAKLQELFNKWEQLVARIDYQRQSVAAAKRNFSDASDNNYSPATEILLYTLGFKWLWGAYTGYAPTTVTTQHAERLEQARIDYATLLDTALPELTSILSDIYRMRDRYVHAWETASQNSGDFHTMYLLQTSAWAVGDTISRFANAMRAHADTLTQLDALLDSDVLTYDQVYRQLGDTTWGHNAAYAPIAPPSRQLLTHTDSIGHQFLQQVASSAARLRTARLAYYNLYSVTPGVRSITLPEEVLAATITSVDTRLSALNRRMSLIDDIIKQSGKSITPATLSDSSVAIEYDRLRRAYESTGDAYHSALTRYRMLQFTIRYLRRIAQAYHRIQSLENLQILYYERALASLDSLEYAREHNWWFSTEFLLYTFGFKWLWGIFTNYAPSSYTATQSRILTRDIQYARDMREQLADEITAVGQEFATFWRYLTNISKNDVISTIRQEIKSIFQQHEHARINLRYKYTYLLATRLSRSSDALAREALAIIQQDIQDIPSTLISEQLVDPRQLRVQDATPERLMQTLSETESAITKLVDQDSNAWLDQILSDIDLQHEQYMQARETFREFLEVYGSQLPSRITEDTTIDSRSLSEDLETT